MEKIYEYCGWFDAEGKCWGWEETLEELQHRFKIVNAKMESMRGNAYAHPSNFTTIIVPYLEKRIFKTADKTVATGYM